MVEIELSVFGAIDRLVALGQAVSANDRRALGALRSWVSVLFTNAAGSCEDSRQGAIDLGVSVFGFALVE
jgi:hypothetical protein